MDKYLYICYNCGKEYIPNRRLVQKFCSNSCRTRSFMLRNVKNKLSVPNPNTEISNKKEEPTKIDKMSLAGIGNAAAGVAVVKLAENLFTSEANKPATKRDINNLMKNLRQRYHPILNIALRQDGAKAYYDMETKNYVYIKNNFL